MKTLLKITFAAVTALATFQSALGQRGDRDRSEGDRGRSEGDRSRWGGFSGGFSGPPGGFSGGPSFGGSPFGGSPFGGFGGGMIDMVRRFDRNGNNMIDPDETQGPAGFFLQRMAQNNPKIALSRPIPIDLIASEMERMRSGRMEDSSISSSSSGSETQQDQGPKLLVPDFGGVRELPAVPGFGIQSDTPSIEITDRDRAEAEERLRRYDRNGDKVLDREEIARSRYSPEDVAQYDRNKDGKLTLEELAVRYAARRLAEESQSRSNGGFSGGWGGSSSSGWGSGSSSGWSRGGDRNVEDPSRSRGGSNSSNAEKKPERFGDAKSYKTSGGSTTISGLPSFFTTSDINNDAQVTLSEFAGSLTEAALNEFQQWDLNGDGIITARECQAAVKAGIQVGGNSGSTTASSSQGSGSSGSTSQSAPSASGKYSDADLQWAKDRIAKYDQDKDGMLSKSEAAKMLVPPKGADLNNDGKITAEEYAAFRSK